ncbi:MAG: translation elongation factor EF-1 subunit alpha [Candidatus ainarchaeum sp.]|nr:translation elongation factor EF-1 subunit alpha [Candidatus ainarchaeum sp.]MDD3975839.1 translation elongation factor EF-1 subunit alpha [Candidatus ainarchaeum sp.]
MASDKPHINVIFIGHIDQGKSTLVGRLMYDSDALSEQEYRKLEALAQEKGKGTFAFAYMMDTLKEERERGVTIDVNYKKFETKTKFFTVIDAPGHADYIKNMITGTSQADAAVLLVGAKEGIMPQTKEHSFLAKVLGINQVIVAINKMDEVSYDQKRFDEVKLDVLKLLKGSGYKEDLIQIIPVSAWMGDNVAKKSDKLPWYNGPTLLDAMDKFTAPASAENKDLRLPVQDVYNIKGVGTVPVGKVSTGIMKPNDKIVIMPENVQTEVKSIEMHHEQLDAARPGDNIGFNLRKIGPRDIKRGSIIGHVGKTPTVADEFTAQIIVLFHPSAITPGYTPVFHMHTAQISCTITEIVRTLDTKNGGTKEENPKFIKAGDSAIVKIKPTQPLCVEKYSDFPQLGRLAIRDMGKTVAAGVVIDVKAKQY